VAWKAALHEVKEKNGGALDFILAEFQKADLKPNLKKFQAYTTRRWPRPRPALKSRGLPRPTAPAPARAWLGKPRSMK